MNMIANTTSDWSVETPNTHKKKVAFHHVEIIEFPYTIGDSCSAGPPITCSAVEQARTSLGVTYFEQFRPLRRSTKQLHLSSESRRSLLLRNGFSVEEILKATATTKSARKDTPRTSRKVRISPAKPRRRSSVPKDRPSFAELCDMSSAADPNFDRMLVQTPPIQCLRAPARRSSRNSRSNIFTCCGELQTMSYATDPDFDRMIVQRPLRISI